MILRKVSRKQVKLKVQVSGTSGSGKAQPLYSKLVTPNGYTLMKDIKVGDLISGEDGKFVDVTGIYPKGLKKTWRFTLNDGTQVDSCEDHLWRTSTISERSKNNKKGSIKTTTDIVNSLKVSNKANHFIQLCEPVEFPKKEFIIHPYLLGILLGDGCFRSNSLFFTNNDEELINYIKPLLPSNMYITKRGNNYIFSTLNNSDINPYIEELKYLNLWNHLSYDKFIPKDYLTSSKEDRIELLNGLIDTDGYSYKGKKGVEYSTSSKQLSEDIKFLVESLGGYISNTKCRETHYIKNNERFEGALNYRMNIILPNGIIPCKLKRRLENISDYTKYLPVRNIVNAEYLGEIECQCISVNNKSHLYLTDNFIPTHNTYSSLLIAHGITGDWSKIALIDTENGSGDLYENLGDYNVLTLNSFSPEKYIEAITLCENSGIEVIIIDSLTHSWDWLLEYHAQITANDPKGNSYTAWAKVRPIQAKLKNKILQSSCHIICTVRKETDYSMNNDNGKVTVQKVGLKDKNAAGFDYEVSLVLDINQSHYASSTKDRTQLFTDQMPFKITPETGMKIKEWCNSGKSDTESLFTDAAIEINNASDKQELGIIYNKYNSLQSNTDFIGLLTTKKQELENEKI